jgi:hypothetical protein
MTSTLTPALFRTRKAPAFGCRVRERALAICPLSRLRERVRVRVFVR